jgi:hydroxymethylbilane synthase
MIFSSENKSLADLPKGVKIGTSSLRRKCQIKNVRPDAQLVDIRGNVSTRLKKVGKDADAVILAAAGIKRLGLPPGIPIDLDSMIPSPGQGVIAVEARKNDHDTISLVQKLDHSPTRICAETERLFLATLGADCRFPVAAYAKLEGSEIVLSGMIGRSDFSMTKATIRGKDSSIGKTLAQMLLKKLG